MYEPSVNREINAALRRFFDRLTAGIMYAVVVLSGVAILIKTMEILGAI